VSGTGSEPDAAGSFALGRWQVNRLGYGAMQLAGNNVFGPPRDSDEVIQGQPSRDAVPESEAGSASGD
jgi:hypothetical protein